MDRIKFDHANKILSEVATQFDVEGLQLKREGICSINIDNKFDVQIEASENTNQLQLLGLVADSLSLDNTNIFQQLLIENMGDNGGNYFAINSSTNNLLLLTNIDMDNIDFEYFVKRLDQFVNYLESTLENMKIQNNDVSSRTTAEEEQAVHSQPKLVSNNTNQAKLFAQLGS